MLLSEYIEKHHDGIRKDFASSQGVMPQQVNKWLAGNWLVIDGRLYSPKQELKTMINDIFGRVNESGNVDVLYKSEGEAVCKFDETLPTIYPVDSNHSAYYEHPEGITLERADADKIGLEIE